MVITPERLSEAIAGIYAAVGNPDGFNGALRRIRTLLNGSSGMLFTPFVDPGRGGYGFVDHVNPDFFAQYRAYYWDKDPWAREGQRRGYVVTGSTVSDEALISQQALGKEEIYPDLLIPMDTTRLCCSVIVGDEDAALPRTYLSIYRGVGSRPFKEEERRALALLGPHVLQGLRLAYRLGFAEAACAAAYDAFHEVNCGVVLVDQEKNVVFMNRTAERLCARERGLSVVKQMRSCVLRATLARVDAALQQAIDSALRVPVLNTGKLSAASMPVAIQSAQGGGALLVTVLPLPMNMRQPMGGQARAVVFVEDPTAKLPSEDRLFIAVFGLTPAECRVAKALLAGEPPKTIADRFAVSENTVRTQIKALYAKTDTRGITALIGLLSRLAETQASTTCATTARS